MRGAGCAVRGAGHLRPEDSGLRWLKGAGCAVRGAGEREGERARGREGERAGFIATCTMPVRRSGSEGGEPCNMFSMIIVIHRAT